MSNQDPIADLLTRLRNGQSVHKQFVMIPYSKVKEAIVRVLHQEGYVAGYEAVAVDGKSELRVDLKYYQSRPVMEMIKRISKPGLRVYKTCEELSKVMNGLGTAIISTSRGVMTSKEARKIGIGGEILCEVA